MRKVLFIVLLGFFVGQEQAFAQWGNNPWVWWPAGMIGVGGWPYPQQPMIQQPSGQVICQPKPARHRGLDVLAAAGTVAGISGLATGSWQKAGFGAMAGAGGGALYANHEMECFTVQQFQVQPVQPTATAQPQIQPPAPVQPVPLTPSPPIVVESAKPRLAGVEFRVVNESVFIIMVEAAGRRATLGSGATARVYTPDIRVFRVQPDGRGSFKEVEIDLFGTEDETLPGWRIPSNPKFKNP